MGISMSPLLSPGFLSDAAPVVTPEPGDGIFSLLWVIIALPALGAARFGTRGW